MPPFRLLLNRLHLILGLLAGLVLLVVGLSGTLLAFRADIDRALEPGLYFVTPQPQRVSVQALVDESARTFPGERLTLVHTPKAPNEAFRLHLRGGREVFADPYTGRVVGSRQSRDAFVNVVLRLHRELLVGPIGRYVTAGAALVLVALALSGLALWWPRKRAMLASRLKVRWSAPRQRVNYDVHSVLGFYFALPLMAIALTGAAFTFDEPAKAVYNALTASPPFDASAPKIAPRAGVPNLPIDEAMATAQALFPAATLAAVRPPTPKGGAFQVFLQQPGDPRPNGRTTVWIDPYSGAVAKAIDPFQAPLGWRLYFMYNYPLHTGEIAGWPTQLLALVVSAMPAVFFVSGVAIWWPKRRNRKARLIRSTTLQAVEPAVPSFSEGLIKP